jgi:hypothetical protein
VRNRRVCIITLTAVPPFFSFDAPLLSSSPFPLVAPLAPPLFFGGISESYYNFCKRINTSQYRLGTAAVMQKFESSSTMTSRATIDSDCDRSHRLEPSLQTCGLWCRVEIYNLWRTVRVETHIPFEGRRWPLCQVYDASGLSEALVTSKVYGVT